MKNQDNTQSPEKFNPPTKCAVEGENQKPCFVYDARAWANKNKSNRQRGSNQEA